MRIKNQFFKSISGSLLVVLSLSFMLIGCEKDDDKPQGDPPSISLSTTTLNALTGTNASTVLTLNAPEKLKKLVILKNGLPFSTENFNGETTATFNFSYSITETAPGTVVNFSFQALDMLDRYSELKTFTITVVEEVKEIVQVTGNITGNVTWTANKIYRLNGFVRVQDGAVLTIQPGTLIIGNRESKGTLIVQMGGRIIADGTADNPIIMTSERAPGLRNPGDWGGLVICGRAKNNITEATGQPTELEGGYGGFHGGNNDDDNSGILRYVRIEFAGVPINPNEEVNSLTMGSVGRGTIIENVMCAYGLDDAFEWFGGTVNAKNLISYRNLDDDLDVDLGYSGNVQFALVIRGENLADQSGSNGFEVDNNGSGSNAQPFTSAVFANVTVIGPKSNRETPISLQFQHAAQLRRNSRISIYNSFLTGFPYGLYIDDDRAGSGQAFLDNELQIRNVILAGVEHWGGNGYGSAGNVFTGPPSNGAQHPTNPRGQALRSHANFPGGQAAYEEHFNTVAFNNTLMPKWQDAGINPSVFEDGVINPVPQAGSMLLTAAKWDNTPKAGAFFQKVNFLGAVGTQNWTAPWAEWNSHIVKYY
ncbi:MAG TPA: hypothetical protein PKE03_01660 [Bacteroidales bacterium]|nr:hypothetical protein [Bacteroidales bacterium]